MIFKVFFEFKNKESAPRKLDVNLTHYSKYFIYFFYKTVKTFFNITKSFSVSFYILVFLLSSLGFFYNPIETFADSGVPTILSYQYGPLLRQPLVHVFGQLVLQHLLHQLSDKESLI